VAVQPEIVSALATLVLALDDPHPLDVGVVLVADTANHPVVVQGVDYVGVILRTRPPLGRLHEKGIIVARLFL